MMAGVPDSTTSSTVSLGVSVAQEHSDTVTVILLAVLAVAVLVVIRRVRRIRRHGPGTAP